MMNSDQLRELAEWHDERADSCVYEHERRRHQETATYLRQCAEQEPVAWRFKVRVWLGEESFEEQWRASTERRDGDEPLYAFPQPVSGEQPEPSAAQPLSDEQIAAAMTTDPQAMAAAYALMQGDMTVGEWKAALREIVRAVERAAYERAAQECIETAAELRRCADGCTDGRYDWKADGALDCADAIHALGRQQ